MDEVFNFCIVNENNFCFFICIAIVITFHCIGVFNYITAVMPPGKS